MTDAELLQHWMSRQDGGLTQAQAAERLGLTQSGVNQVLKEKCNLSEVGRKFIAHLISDLDAPTPEPQAITCDACGKSYHPDLCHEYTQRVKLITKLWNELWQRKEAQI